MRLIDADAAYERAQADSRRGALEDWEFDMIVNLLDSAPTVDTAPVIHGEWRHSRYVDCSESFELVKCSNCGHEAYAMAIYVRGGNYCPNCGAKMDGGDPDGR